MKPRRIYDPEKVYTNEDVLQADCWQWLWDTYEQTHLLCWHVPNGGARTKVQAAQFTAMGVVAGVHDIHFYWQSQFYIMELKVGTNTLSDKQEAWRDAMVAQGAIFYEVRSLKTFQNIITTILTQTPMDRLERIKYWFFNVLFFTGKK